MRAPDSIGPSSLSTGPSARQDPKKLARQVARTEAALHAWKLTADLRRERWNEAQAERDAKRRQWEQKMRAVKLGMLTGAVAFSLVGAGVWIGVARGDTLTLWREAIRAAPVAATLAPPQLPPEALAVPTPPPAAEPLVVAVVDEHEPETSIVEPNSTVFVHEGGWYGAEFRTRRDNVAFVFIGPSKRVWEDNDPIRMCKKKARDDDGTWSCQYQRNLVSAVNDGLVEAGLWTIQACQGADCETLATFDVTAPRTASVTPTSVASPSADEAAPTVAEADAT